MSKTAHAEIQHLCNPVAGDCANLLGQIAKLGGHHMHVRNVTGQCLEGKEGISLNNLCIYFTTDPLLQLCMIIFAAGVFIFSCKFNINDS